MPPAQPDPCLLRLASAYPAWTLLLAVSVVAALVCSVPAQARSAMAGPAWSHGLTIYEVDLGRYTQAGTFAAFEEHLPALAEMGVGILWLMPIHPRSGNPPDKPRSDSPYCVRDYFEVNPKHGTKADFKRLVEKVHAAGMYVILDWVSNHTSWGNALVTERPDFYKKDKDGSIAQAGPWRDVAQLDYANREVWDYMYEARKYWMTAFGVDGFREDVAGMVPIEHWTWLRPKLEAVKPLFMLAEADEPRHHPAFDATYDWTLQPYAYMIARGTWPATSLDEMLAGERRLYPAGALRMRHLTNHDMQGSGYAWANRKYLDKSEYDFLEKVPLEDKYGRGDRAFAVLCATLPGKFMLWNGQEVGIVGRTPRPIPWRESPYRGFYTKLLRLCRHNPAVYEGEFTRLVSSADENVYAYARRRLDNVVVVVLNLCGEPRSFTLDCRGAVGQYADAFTGEVGHLSDRAALELGPWDYRALVRGTPPARR